MEPDTQLSTLVHAQRAMPHGVFHVVVTEGVSVGKSVILDGSHPGRFLVGSSTSCDFALDDREVSRRHLAFEIAGAFLQIVDLDSKNGTEVDHLRVREAWLRGGERIRIGSTVLHVSYDAGGRNPSVPFAKNFGRMLGESREMRRLYPLCQKLANARVPVLIEGETGTGKEVLAEALHEEGPWSDAPYVVFDCTAVPANLIESELFGHEKGAFTGAVSSRRGVFEQAHGGTLLIDEIGDLELPLQAKLLRVLERGELRRVGGDRAIRVDVRILCATRRDLDAEVQARRFRDDLFHRLAVARIELPPLRERAADIAPLAGAFWAQLGGDGAIPPAVLQRWESHRWAGNVRELRNAVARYVALGDDALSQGQHATAASVPVNAGQGYMEAVLEAKLPWTDARNRVLDELEKRYVERVLQEHNGVVTHAAAASGIARRHFQRIMARRRDGDDE